MINDKNLILQTTWQSLLLAIVYYVAGQLSFTLSVSYHIVSLSVFAAEGFSLAAMILLGARVWPGVFLGQMALILANDLSLEVAVGIALINSLEAILAATLFRFFKLQASLTSLRDMLGLSALIFLILQPLSALFGNLVLWLNGNIPIEQLGYTSFAWWQSNVLGQMIITPLVLHFFYAQKSWRLTLSTFVIASNVLLFGLLVLGNDKASYNPSADTLAFAQSLVLVVLVGVFFNRAMVSLAIGLLAFMALFFSHQLTGVFVHDQSVMVMDLNAYLLSIVGVGQLLMPLLQVFKVQQQQQEKLYQQLQKIAPYVSDVIFVYRMDTSNHGRFLFIDERVAEFLHVSADQVRANARLVLTVLQPNDQLRLLNALKTSALHMQAFEMEVKIQPANAPCSWLSIHARPEQAENGGLLWYGSFANITKYVVAQNLANQHKEALASILQSARSISIIASDLNGIITVFNRGAENMLGYCAEEMIGKKTPECLHSPEEVAQRCHELSKQLGKSVKGFEAFVTETMSIDGHSIREWTYIRKDGGQLTVQLSISAIYNQALEITGYLGIAEDITQSKRDETERGSLLQIITESHDFIGIGDMQARLTYLNKAARRALGIALDADVKSLKISAFHTPEDYQQIIMGKLFPDLFDKGYWQGENQLCNQVDGHLIPISQLSMLHCDKNGVPQYISSIMRDISEQKQLEQSLQQAKQNAEKLARAKSEFLAQMSHEIRTPMNAVIGLSQLALNKNITPDVKDYLQKIYHASTNLLGILNDILDFSKLEASGMQIDCQPFDLNALLENLRSLFSERAIAKGLDFSINLEDGVPHGIVGDVLRLQQILVNLLGNAIKFTEHGEVSLSVHLDRINNSEVCLMFSVKDSGIGISPENLNQLFQPFSQVDQSSTRRFSGTGLGLVISQKLLQLMGSEFQIKSTPGKGSQFNFSLSLGICTLEAVRLTQPTPIEAIKNLQRLDGLRILVAEDNTINQQIVKEFLKLSGIHVELVEHGQAALDRLAEAPYDVVLMDIHMPVLDGYQATRRIREQPQWTNLPIIALTAGVTPEEQEQCLAVGMNDVVAKPIDPNQLISTIKKWLKDVPQIRPAVDVASHSQAHYGPMGPASARMDTERLAGFDLTNLLTMLNGDWSAALAILKTFAQDISHSYEAIETACCSPDLSTAIALAHQLKGAAGNIGAMLLYEAANALETRLKQQQNHQAELTALNSAITEAIQSITRI